MTKSRSDDALLTVDEIYGKTNNMRRNPKSRSDDTLRFIVPPRRDLRELIPCYTVGCAIALPTVNKVLSLRDFLSATRH
ncbi:MAG: hypothetical protein FWF53_10775 [Candidatus Azobacteroides sp.]|nr:hypothetical protein [Candidatus Azobacteroides sp.]